MTLRHKDTSSNTISSKKQALNDTPNIFGKLPRGQEGQRSLAGCEGRGASTPSSSSMALRSAKQNDFGSWNQTLHFVYPVHCS